MRRGCFFLINDPLLTQLVLFFWAMRSTECSRQALYLQDCQIPQNKFLRERAAMGEGEGGGKCIFLSQ